MGSRDEGADTVFGLLPFLEVPMSWSSMALICSEADMVRMNRGGGTTSSTTTEDLWVKRTMGLLPTTRRREGKAWRASTARVMAMATDSTQQCSLKTQERTVTGAAGSEHRADGRFGGGSDKTCHIAS